MSRSKWKGPFLKLVEKTNYARNTLITPTFIGMTVTIHNGNSLKEIVITESMLGHKMGEFVFTRIKHVFKKKKKQKRK